MDVQIDVAIRIVGTVQDFREHHAVRVTLSGPDLVELGRLVIPVPPRDRATSHFPGYEINAHLATRISLPGDTIGGYDLSFALDDEPEHRHRSTISLVLKPPTA